ncbi:unnamed protein product [Allacma fusca]|uniref:Uncharacterized protein n=1 Tax=Allacma fusca TaxID=39272 RepID=A0A8J2PPZ1_9HEXA|nr:unnamed protein product [Allacma fusca]
MISKIFIDSWAKIYVLTLSVGFVVGQNRYQEFMSLIRDVPCKPNGEYCKANERCCSGYCVDFKCGPCKIDGLWCVVNSDCCSDYCVFFECGVSLV